MKEEENKAWSKESVYGADQTNTKVEDVVDDPEVKETDQQNNKIMSRKMSKMIIRWQHLYFTSLIMIHIFVMRMTREITREVVSSKYSILRN